MVDTDDTRRTTDAGRRTTPWVWHKLPTGERTNIMSLDMDLIRLKFSGGWVFQGLHILWAHGLQGL